MLKINNFNRQHRQHRQHVPLSMIFYPTPVDKVTPPPPPVRSNPGSATEQQTAYKCTMCYWSFVVVPPSFL